MFNAEQSREEWEDELHREGEDSEDSLSRSELEFHLYSQLHYSSNFVELEKAEEEEEHEKQDRDTPAQQGSSDSSNADDLGQDHSLSLHLEGASGSNTDADKRDIWWICEKDKKAQIYNKNRTSRTYRTAWQPDITTDAPPAPKQAEDKGQSSVYCYNCAEKGHFGHACTKPRMSEDVFVHVPYINHYDTLEEIQRRQEERKAKAQSLSEMLENCSFSFAASGTPPAQVLEENCDFPTEGKPKKKRRRKRNRKNKMIDGQRTTEEFQPS